MGSFHRRLDSYRVHDDSPHSTPDGAAGKHKRLKPSPAPSLMSAFFEECHVIVLTVSHAFANAVLAAGGGNNRGVKASAELYDLSTGRWTLTGPMNDARQYFQMVALQSGAGSHVSHSVFVTGGHGKSLPRCSRELKVSRVQCWLPEAMTAMAFWRLLSCTIQPQQPGH